jgi:hypothetical protein
MALESGTYIKDLVSTNPLGTDAISQGDDHVRLIKSVLQNSFPSTNNAPIIPNISGNGDKYLQVNSGATATQWVDLDVTSLTRRKGEIQRPWFQYINSATFRVHAGLYDLDAKGTYVSWDTYLDWTISGSNGWRYLYLDYSSISGTTVTATDFTETSTVPTYTESKHGWYNGNDRCIFAFYVSGGALTPFYNDGSTHVEYRDDQDNGEVASSNYVTVTIPPLGAVGGREVFGEFTFKLHAPVNATSSSDFYVTAAEGSGHFIGRVESDGGSSDNAHLSGNKRIVVYKSGASTMQVYITKSGGSAGNTCRVFTNGFFLPQGM